MKQTRNIELARTVLGSISRERPGQETGGDKEQRCLLPGESCLEGAGVSSVTETAVSWLVFPFDAWLNDISGSGILTALENKKFYLPQRAE